MPSNAGLCDTCRHCRVIASDKGSRFYLCRKGLEDPKFPKYPRIPVHRCAGWDGVRPPEPEKTP